MKKEEVKEFLDLAKVAATDEIMERLKDGEKVTVELELSIEEAMRINKELGIDVFPIPKAS